MRKILCLFLGIFMLLFSPFIINAEEETYFQENGKDRVVDHSLFTANQLVNSTDTVNGINFVAGNTIKVTGSNEYGVYAGNDITVSNNILKDLFVAGNNIVITNDAKLDRDLYAAGSNITINSNVEKNAFIAGTVVTLKDTTIKGNISIACDHLLIEGVVTINGKLKINNDATIDSESNLMVDTKETYDSNSEFERFNTTNMFIDLLISIAGLLIIGFVINGLFPKVYDKVLKDITVKGELKNLLLGLIGFIVMPIAAIILLCTIVGLLLGFIVLFIYILMLLISLLYGSAVLGNIILTKLFKAKDNSYLSITIGVIVIKLISLLPTLGGTIYFIAILYGMGKSIELFKNRIK